MDGQTDRQTEGLKDGGTEGQKDERTEGWKIGRTEEQMDRTDRTAIGQRHNNNMVKP